MPLTNPPGGGTSDHDALTGVSADDHHAQAHAIGGADHTGTLAHSALSGLTTGDDHTQYQKESEKGATNGYASLNASTKIPIAEIPTGSTSTTVPLGDHTHADASVNFSTASQAISANTVTYITGSGILIPSTGIAQGQMYRWYLGISKTAAGTATPIWTPRIGTNQTTADTTVLTNTGTAQVATLSGTLIVLTAHIRTASATGVIVFSVNTGAASFGIGGSTVSGSFDTTTRASQRFGLCVNTGASAAWTVNSVRGELVG